MICVEFTIQIIAATAQLVSLSGHFYSNYALRHLQLFYHAKAGGVVHFVSHGNVGGQALRLEPGR